MFTQWEGGRETAVALASRVGEKRSHPPTVLLVATHSQDTHTKRRHTLRYKHTYMHTIERQVREDTHTKEGEGSGRLASEARFGRKEHEARAFGFI